MKTGVHQGCVTSSLLFNVVIDWVLCHKTEDQRRGIRWTPFSTISLKKTEAMCVNVSSPAKIKVGEKELAYTDTFTYLGIVVCHDGGTSMDIKNRLNKARNAFMSLQPVWRSANYNTSTKIKIYQSCVLSTLLYGSECWRMTKHDLSRLASFRTASLRKILRIFWPQTISNSHLLKQEDMRTIITRRRWRWTGHVERKISMA